VCGREPERRGSCDERGTFAVRSVRVEGHGDADRDHEQHDEESPKCGGLIAEETNLKHRILTASRTKA